MDTDTLILSVVSAVGGGTLLQIGKKLFSSNRLKELSDIIKVLGDRVDKQDAEIIQLKIDVGKVNKEKIELSESLNRYKFAHTFLALCKHRAECPIAIELNKNAE